MTKLTNNRIEGGSNAGNPEYVWAEVSKSDLRNPWYLRAACIFVGIFGMIGGFLSTLTIIGAIVGIPVYLTSALIVAVAFMKFGRTECPECDHKIFVTTFGKKYECRECLSQVAVKWVE